MQSRKKMPIRLLLAALITALFAPIALALDASEMFTDPEKEARAREVGRQLRCLVCQNQSIFDSNSALAKDLRVVVREQMDTGASDQEILDYIAVRFGDYVLLNPRMNAQTYILWGSPIAFLLLGLIALISYHRGRSPRSKPEPLSAADQEEAQRLLKGETE